MDPPFPAEWGELGVEGGGGGVWPFASEDAAAEAYDGFVDFADGGFSLVDLLSFDFELEGGLVGSTLLKPLILFWVSYAGIC